MRKTAFPMATDLNDLLTSPEVADLLGWSVATVNRKAAAGEIPTARQLPGAKGTRLFLRSDIDSLRAALAAEHAAKAAALKGAS